MATRISIRETRAREKEFQKAEEKFLQECERIISGRTYKHFNKHQKKEALGYCKDLMHGAADTIVYNISFCVEGRE